MEKQEALNRLKSIEQETKELRKIIERVDKPKNIKERVIDLSSACKETGRDYDIFLNSIKGLSIDTQAYEKLKVWVEALNEGERVTSGGYAPYFDLSKKPGFGFFFSHCVDWGGGLSDASSRLKLKNSELALYCGKQAELTWYEYILG